MFLIFVLALIYIIVSAIILIYTVDEKHDGNDDPEEDIWMRSII